MKTTTLKNTLTLIASSAMLSVFIVGCDLSDTGDASRNTLKISPSSTNILTQGSAFFTVEVNTNQIVALPLRWSVENPAIGTIVSSAGQSAVYQAGFAPGSNIIIVRDQGDKEGLARITVSRPESDEPVAPIIITNTVPAVTEPTGTTTAEQASQTVNIILTNGTSTTRGTVEP